MGRMLRAGVVAVMLTAGAGAAGAACQKPAGAKAIEQEIAAWINAERAKKGLSKLGISAQLRGAAEAHACDMAKRGFFDHEGPGGPSFLKRVRKTGYDYSAAVENIANSSQGGAEPAMRLWRKSAGHWKNLMNGKLDDMAVAVATDGTKVYYVYVGAGN